MNTILGGFSIVAILLGTSGLASIGVANILKRHHDAKIKMLNKRIKTLEADLKRANATAMHNKRMREFYEERSGEYRRAFFEEQRKTKVEYKYIHVPSNNDLVPKEVLKEAFKKLMIYSHPDKGNCKDTSDFIKYKDIYDKLK